MHAWQQGLLGSSQPLAAAVSGPASLGGEAQAAAGHAHLCKHVSQLALAHAVDHAGCSLGVGGAKVTQGIAALLRGQHMAQQVVLPIWTLAIMRCCCGRCCL